MTEHVRLPSKSTAELIAKRFDLRQVVLSYLTADGRMGYASYGKNRHECDAARLLADSMYEAAERHLAETPAG